MSTVTQSTGRRWALTAAGAALALAFLAPYVVMLLGSLRSSSDNKATPPSFLPKVWQWSTYADVLGDERFLAWLRTSAFVALASTVIVILVAVPAAYMTARYRFPGRTPFLLLVLITQMFSPTALAWGSTASSSSSTSSTLRRAHLTNAAFNPRSRCGLHGFSRRSPPSREAALLDGVSRGSRCAG